MMFLMLCLVLLKIDRALKQLACHKASTDNGLVNKLLEHAKAAFTSMFHFLVSVLWDTTVLLYTLSKGLATLSNSSKRDTDLTLATTAASLCLMSLVNTTSWFSTSF